MILEAIAHPGPVCKETHRSGILQPHPCTPPRSFLCRLLSDTDSPSHHHHHHLPPPPIGKEPLFLNPHCEIREGIDSLFLLPASLPLLTVHLCSVFPPLAVSTSSGLRKLCYHGDA